MFYSHETFRQLFEEEVDSIIEICNKTVQYTGTRTPNIAKCIECAQELLNLMNGVFYLEIMADIENAVVALQLAYADIVYYYYEQCPDDYALLEYSDELYRIYDFSWG